VRRSGVQGGGEKGGRDGRGQGSADYQCSCDARGRSSSTTEHAEYGHARQHEDCDASVVLELVVSEKDGSLRHILRRLVPAHVHGRQALLSALLSSHTTSTFPLPFRGFSLLLHGREKVCVCVCVCVWCRCCSLLSCPPPPSPPNKMQSVCLLLHGSRRPPHTPRLSPRSSRAATRKTASRGRMGDGGRGVDMREGLVAQGKRERKRERERTRCTAS